MLVGPNQLIELQLEEKNGPKVYRTRVEDAYDNLILVGAPLEKGTLVPVRVGTVIKIEFRLADSLHEGRFTNEAIVEKRFKSKIPLLQLRLLGDWEKQQDRRFVRVPVFIDAILTPIIEAEKQPEQAGIILNLSGGGFLLRTSYTFALEDFTEIAFKMEAESVVALAKVARLVISKSEQDYGFGFVDLREKTRQAIIQYVFKRQLELAALARRKREPRPGSELI